MANAASREARPQIQPPPRRRPRAKADERPRPKAKLRCCGVTAQNPSMHHLSISCVSHGQRDSAVAISGHHMTEIPVTVLPNYISVCQCITKISLKWFLGLQMLQGRRHMLSYRRLFAEGEGEGEGGSQLAYGPPGCFPGQQSHHFTSRILSFETLSRIKIMHGCLCVT